MRSLVIALLVAGWAATVARADDAPRPPTTYYAFRKEVKRAEWTTIFDKWHSQCVTGGANLQGRAGGNMTGFAQSFVPHREKIAAVALCVYPVSGIGWIRLDVCRDENNAPSHEVLSRTWLRVDAGCPVSHYGFMVFDIPDIEVEPQRKYWLTYLEFLSKDSPSGSLSNLGRSINNDYVEGQLMSMHEFAPSLDRDARFQIISSCPTIPWLRSLADAERELLPSYPWDDCDWRETSPLVETPEIKVDAWSRKVLGLVGRLRIHNMSGAGRIGLSLELQNTAGTPLAVAVRNNENLHLEVRGTDGRPVPPLGIPRVDEFVEFRAGTRFMTVPLDCYVGYSLTPPGWQDSSPGRGNLDLGRQHWDLSPGIYTLYGQYFSRGDTWQGAGNDDKVRKWTGRLTLLPLTIRVKEDRTAETPAGNVLKTVPEKCR